MFEKEAEEYTIENVCSTCYFEKPCENKCEAFGCADSKTYVLKAFKDGAEFGYNKANEWHYVKDGDLPSEEGGWVCNQDGLPCYFDWSTEQWLDVEGTQVRTTEWCNMPHKESE